MLSFTLLAAVSLCSLKTTTLAQIAPMTDVPAGFQIGMSTQDYEPAGQQSACTVNGGSCSAPTPLFPSASGPDPLPDGVYAAAISPALGGGPNSCAPCGFCYKVINAGMPYCDGSQPGCGGSKGPGGPIQQTGPQSILIVIVNHCPSCDDVSGHFDINQAPAGWNNPKIYWQQVDESECGVGATSSTASIGSTPSSNSTGSSGGSGSDGSGQGKGRRSYISNARASLHALKQEGGA